MALITSRYTLDKKDDVIRKHLAERADLIAAVRLPNTAFKGNAGTEVTTDILFLQKRFDGQEPAGEDWTETGIVLVEDRAVALNQYYITHPETYYFRPVDPLIVVLAAMAIAGFKPPQQKPIAASPPAI